MPNDRPRSRSPLGKLSDAVPPLTASLTQDIRAAYEQAGSPSYKTLNDLNRRARRGVLSKATISRILTPDPYATRDQKSLPNWNYYEDLLQVLNQDPTKYEARWEVAQEEWRARSPEPDEKPDEHKDHAGSESKPWWRSRGFFIGGSIGGVVLLAVVVVGLLLLNSADPPTSDPAASSSDGPDKGRDNTDPHGTGCTPQMDEQTYWSHLYRDWPTNTGQTDALITMHYSPECRTSWADLKGAPPGTQAVLHRNSDGTELRCTAGPDGSCTTKQLSDRGTTIYAFARTGDAYGQTRSH